VLEGLFSIWGQFMLTPKLRYTTCSMAETEMRLWTIQRAEAYEQAERRGVLRADGRRVPGYLRPAYRWMMDQMWERLPNYDGEYPIWAYPNKPDLRRGEHQLGTPGLPAVRLELLAHPSDVLMSNEQAWNAIISGAYCSYTDEEYDRFCKRYGHVWAWGAEVAADPELRDVIHGSWQRIFKPESFTRYPDWGDDIPLQACLGQVSLDQIVDVTPFVSR
jgi:hypothetical protein